MLAMDKMTVKAGQDLIRQGEPGNAFYVIEKGEFDIIIDGCRVTTFRRGGSFGEVALIREQPRAATVTAITSAVCWRLERSASPRREVLPLVLEEEGQIKSSGEGWS